MSLEELKGHILQVQSQVVHGFVGNSASTVPFNMLGFQTSSLNICQYSCHLGYKINAGKKMPADDMSQILDSLKKNTFYKNWTHILSGYLGSKEVAIELSKFIREVQTITSENGSKEQVIQYVCDPVLGDEGRLYVTEELIDVYREILLPLAQVATPNSFEAEKLSNITIKNIDDAIKAIDWFHDKGVEYVILTSAKCYSDNPSKLTMIGSRRFKKTQQNSESKFESKNDSKFVQRFSIDFDKLEGFYSGTGDVTAALITSWLKISNGDIKKTIEMALGGIQSVLKYTEPSSDLNIIPCRNFFLSPILNYEASELN